jgi:hypothetical protein
MKKNLLVFTILISMFSVVNVSQANANCSAENPCGTWAMLDSQGIVTNVIVCQPSVCGGGTWAGQTVVPQVAPNPVTNDPTGQGSFIGNKETGSSVTYSEGTFTINNPTTINRLETFEVENKTTIAAVSIPVLSSTFTYEDTIGKNYNTIPLKIGTVNSSLSTDIYVQESIKNTNKVEKEIIKEIVSYDENGNEIITYVTETVLEDKISYEFKQDNMNFISQITQNQFTDTIVASNLNLLNSKINTFLQLLSDWFKK